jgi:hypothetical protein
MSYVERDTCLRCEALLREIAIKNKIIADLQEKVSEKEWAKGI